MPRTTLSSQSINRTGLTPTFSAVDQVNGNEFLNVDERTYLHVKTTSNSTVLTIPTPITIDGLTVSDLAISIGTSSERIIGPFPLQYYNQTDGKVYLDWSVGTGVTAAVIRL